MSASAAMRRLERLARVPVALSESRQLAELTRPRLVELLADGGADDALEDVLAALRPEPGGAAAPAGPRPGPVAARRDGPWASATVGERAALAGGGEERGGRARLSAKPRAAVGRRTAARFGREAPGAAHAAGGTAARRDHRARAARVGSGATVGRAAEAWLGSAIGEDPRAVAGLDAPPADAARDTPARAGAEPGPPGAALGAPGGLEPVAPACAQPPLSALAALGAMTPVSRPASGGKALDAEARTTIVRPERLLTAPPRSVAGDGPPRARSAPTSPPLPPPAPARSTTTAPAGSGLQDLVTWWDGEASERERRAAETEAVTAHESFRGALEDVLLAEAHASGIEVRP